MHSPKYSCNFERLEIPFVPRDHNTKRAKLSIDVCEMFVAAKAIFSNFAFAHARLCFSKINFGVIYDI